MSDFTGSVEDSVSNAKNILGNANQFAQAKGGWGQLAQDAAGSYVDSHGGAAGTAIQLGHNAVNAAANTLIGAKDWGNAYRSAKSGHFGDALKSAGWGALALGATASMVIPGVGEAIKGAELGAEAARAGEAASLGGKELAESAVAKEGAAEGSNLVKLAKGANRAHHAADAASRLGSFLNGQGNAELRPQGLTQARIY
jgi:hypothetical protein